jgi:hypothetical protein
MPSRYSAHLSEIGTAVIDELTEHQTHDLHWYTSTTVLEHLQQS